MFKIFLENCVCVQFLSETIHVSANETDEFQSVNCIKGKPIRRTLVLGLKPVFEIS